MDTKTQDRSENPAAPGVGSGALLGLPVMTMKRGGPGEIFIVDECNHLVATFRVKTPDCHKAPYANCDNFDAGLNMDAAKWLIREMQRRWVTESYARFFGPNAEMTDANRTEKNQ